MANSSLRLDLWISPQSNLELDLTAYGVFRMVRLHFALVECWSDEKVDILAGNILVLCL